MKSDDLTAHWPKSDALAEPKANLIGAGWAVAAVFLFSVVFISGKLVDGSATAIQILWFRYFGGLLTVLVALAIRHTPFSELRSRQTSIHAIRAVMGGAGTTAGIYAVMYMPVAMATAISLTDGVLTIFLAVIFLRERLSVGQWLASLTCLVAAQVVVTGSGQLMGHETLDPLVLAIAVAGALCLAIESILIKTITRSEPPIRVLFYVNMFGALIFLAPALWFGRWTDWPVLALLLLLGPIAVFAQLCNIRAYTIANASIVAPMRYSWIIFAAIWGVLLFGEVPGPVFYVGASVILCSGAWLAMIRQAPSQNDS